MRKFAWLCCTLLTACGPDLATESTDTGSTSTGAESTAEATTQPTTGTDATTSSTGDTTGDTTGEETSDATTAAACIGTDFNDDIPEQPMTCGLPVLCGGSEPLRFDPIEPDGWTTDDIERARCMVAAMRDRTPGIVSFRHYGVTAAEDIRTIELLGEQAIVTHTEYYNFGFDYSERLVLVQISAYFAECLNGATAELRKCLIEGFDDVCIDTLECPT